MVTTYHVFDVDGTITHPRKPMDEDFIEKFYSFCKKHKVILVSGSDYNMIIEQIPEKILDIVKLYTCGGIDGISFDVEYEIEDPRLIDRLELFLNTSVYAHKTGKHINYRKGMINFSIVGRNATDELRIDYSKFDAMFNERKEITETLRKEFPDYDVCIGGEISIDITKKGMNKSLVAKDLLTLSKKPFIIFYANQILDGNDYPLAKFIQENNIGYSVQINYEDLKNII
jgi:phosphomannomutase